MIAIIPKSFEELSRVEMLEIFKLRTEIFVVEQQCIYPDHDFTDLDAIHILGITDNQLASYARIYLDQDAHIGRVIVNKQHRNRGFAREIMQYSINWISQNTKHKKISISAQVYLSDFYRKLGFDAKGSMYLEDGIPHIAMTYQL